MDSDQIDRALYFKIRYVKDFRILSGQYFKNMLIEKYQVEPNLKKFRYPNPPAKKDRYNSDVIIRQWNGVFGGNVLEAYQERENPLPNLIKRMKIDFELGGFFTIKNLKWYPDGQMFTDVYILIDKLKSIEHYNQLMQMHNKSQEIEKIDPPARQSHYFKLAEVKHLLNGVGRVVQFFNPYPDYLIDFNRYDQNYSWSLFEGQITEGIGHGFARIIYGDTGKSFCGYYNKGNKRGYGIQSYASGNVQAEGVFKGNERMAKRVSVPTFRENEEPPEMEESELIVVD